MTSIASFGDHLWQSTLFAVLAALLALAFRSNRPQVRYRLWLAASVKFLIPFAPLVFLGSRVAHWSRVGSDSRGITIVMETISQPFSRATVAGPALPVPASSASALQVALLAIWFVGVLAVATVWCVRWRRVAAAVRAGTLAESGRELEALRAREARVNVRSPLALILSDGRLEPGVFGVVTPALLWPRHLSESLNDAQLDAVMSHELCHVRRRDNLAAAVHMLVEATCWFHPLVWWIGARLVDERERACDDEVVRLGFEPQAYAESILKTCEFYVESPLTCVAGVTGSDLRKRIERIMKNDAGAALNVWRKILIATAAVLGVASPVVVGALKAPILQVRSQALELGPESFASISIKSSISGDQRFYPVVVADGRFAVKNHPLRNLISNAYTQDGRLSGDPDWLRSDRFDIEAKAEGNPTQKQMWAMVRRLLADRFKLAVHKETQQLDVYALVMAKRSGTLGPQLRPSSEECIAAAKAMHEGAKPPPALVAGLTGPPQPSQVPCGAISFRPDGTLTGRAATMAELTKGMLAGLLGRGVVDQTGLTGQYDFDLKFAATPMPSRPPQPMPAYGQPAPNINAGFFTAMQEQLGLDLASQMGPVDIVVIDHVERPTPD